MKLYIAIFISFFLASASATGFGVNIDNLLATKAGGIISQSDLSYILQSQYNQYEVIVNAFNAGDVAPKDGKLSAAEFGIAYTRLINFLLGVTVLLVSSLLDWVLVILTVTVQLISQNSRSLFSLTQDSSIITMICSMVTLVCLLVLSRLLRLL